MASADDAVEARSPVEERWYALDPAEVVGQPRRGRGHRVFPLLRPQAGSKRNGPNALPVEQPPSALRRFLAEYRATCRSSWSGAAVVSLVIKQWTTAIVLIVITLFNAVVGLRQQGKAESAMNALQSMMKATARVRRDGAEAEIPAEELVVGDVVLIAAGDEVPADGRIVSCERAADRRVGTDGRERPGGEGRRHAVRRRRSGPGEQSNMAFMHTPVTHGSGVVVVTGTGSGTEVGKIAHMLSAHGERGDAAHEADEHPDAVDRGRGRGSR